MLTYLKNRVRRFFMRRELKKRFRRKQVVSLDQAKQVLVIYDASREDDHHAVCELVKTLQEKEKKVQTMGYVRQPALPEYLMEQLHTSYCRRQDFAWNLKLNTHVLQEFVDVEADILIDLSPPDLFLMKFLTSLSLARYKLGQYHPDMLDLYDLMIEAPKPMLVQEMIRHGLHYLQIIKPPKTDVRKV